MYSCVHMCCTKEASVQWVADQPGPVWNYLDLDGAHQDDLHTAKSVVSGCWTMCFRIAIYFPTYIIFSWNTSRTSCRLSCDVYNLFRLINHSSGIKSAVCVHYIALAACEQLRYGFLCLIWSRSQSQEPEPKL